MSLDLSFRLFCCLNSGPLRSRRRILVGLVLAWLSAVAVRADYAGPVPPPTDEYGATGPYAVVRETLPSPAWPEQVVTVFRPVNAAGRRPVWFFAHGFGGTEPDYYRELIEHLASHGDVVIFSPYPIARPAEAPALYDIMWKGFVAAADRYADEIDLTRLGIAGHSYGGGAVPWLTLQAVRSQGWGTQRLGLFVLAPWYSYLVSDDDLAALPAHAQLVVQVYEDDLINDHRMAIDLFTHVNVAPDNKDFLIVHSDRIEGYNYAASHRVPTGGDRPDSGATRSAFDALDRWAVLRIGRALSAAVLSDDPAARRIALGHGSAEQIQMGVTASGRALRSMTSSSAPVPLFPEGRYNYGFYHWLNPRAESALPSPPPRPRLMSLAARARSARGEDVLIVGAAIAGTASKTLLVRAVGPELGRFHLAGAMPNPRLDSYQRAASDLSLDDWGDAPSPDVVAWAAAETGAFSLTPESRDAALTARFAPGLWTMHAPPSDERDGVVLLELYDADANTAGWLSSVAARARVGLGEDLLIAGFVTRGAGEQRLLIRGIGPALGGLGVADALPDPVLTLYRGSQVVASNDDWSADPNTAADISAAGAQVGAFPLPAGSADASLLVTLPAGVYTATVSARDGRTGVGLVEVYLMP